MGRLNFEDNELQAFSQRFNFLNYRVNNNSKAKPIIASAVEALIDKNIK